MSSFTKKFSGYQSKFEFLAIIVYAMRVGGAALALLLQVVLARFMGQVEYGIFATVWVVMITMGEFLNFGFLSLIQKLVPKYAASNRFDLARGAIFSGIATIILGSLIVSCFYVFLIQTTIPASRSYLIGPLCLIALAFPAYALTDFCSGISRTKDHMVRAFLPSSILRPMALILVVLTMYVAGMGITSYQFLAFTVVVIWGVLLVALGLSLTPVLKELTEKRFTMRSKKWFYMALPMVLVSSFELILYNIDVLILSLLTVPSHVASYFAATKILSIVNFAAFAVASAVMGRMATFYANGESAQLEEVSLRSVRWTFVSVQGLLGLLLFLSPFLLKLFGDDFVTATPVIVILAVGLFVRAFIGPADRLLIMIGAQNLCAIAYLIAVIVDIALNIWLIPKYEAIGAAIATSISMTLLTILLYWLVYKKTNIHMNILNALRHRYGRFLA